MVESNEDLIRRFYATRERDDRDEIRTRSSTIGGKTSGRREVGVFRMVDSSVVEVWFCVEDLERAVGFFG